MPGVGLHESIEPYTQKHADTSTAMGIVIRVVIWVVIETRIVRETQIRTRLGKGEGIMAREEIARGQGMGMGEGMIVER